MILALNERHERFCQEYMIDLNATQAALRAGYAENSAGQQAFALLKNHEIQARLTELKAEREKRTQISADNVVRELARLGFSDIRKLLTDKDQLRPISSLDDDTAAAISSFEVVTKPGAEVDEDGNRTVEYVHKIKMWDKNSALEKLAKHLNMFVDRVEHTGKDGKDLIPEMDDMELARRAAFLLAKAGRKIEGQ